MNIKQASKQSGVSAPNIRFYEKEGLLNPARLPGNDYRDYTEQDIRTLRFIRMLRMLDVPLPVIRSVLAGDASLGSILREQKTALEQRAKQLEGAARFCAELARQDPSVASLDVDACLSRMEDPAQPQNFFCGWVQDYRTLAQVQHQKQSVTLIVLTDDLVFVCLKSLSIYDHDFVIEMVLCMKSMSFHVKAAISPSLMPV